MEQFTQTVFKMSPGEKAKGLVQATSLRHIAFVCAQLLERLRTAKRTREKKTELLLWGVAHTAAEHSGERRTV